MNLLTFQNKEEFVHESVKFISEVIQENDVPKIALSGGTTPKPVYRELANKTLPWESVEFFQVDERYVPKDHADSNCKMIFENLMNIVKGEKFFYFDTKLPIEKSLKDYKEKLPKNGFDLCILGLGTDGHTASLFPHTEAINSEEPVAHTTTEDYSTKDRLTLTFPTILWSKKILILLGGPEKEPLIEKLNNSALSPLDFPARKLAEHPDLTIHLLV